MFAKATFLHWYPLFLISSLGLFLELAVIRWLSGEVRLMAYFKNLPLLAAFLGLAIGFALAGKTRDYRSAFAPVFGLFAVLVLVIGRISSSGDLAYPGGSDENLWAGSASVPYWLALFLFLGLVLIYFLSTMLLFIPLGQATGLEMARHAPLPAYIVNILASLAGVWLFSLLAYLQTPPVIWLGLGLSGMVAYLAGQRLLSRDSSIIFVLVIIALIVLGQGEIWSPYQKLEVGELFLPGKNNEQVKVGYNLDVQHVFYQRAIDLSPDFLDELREVVPDLDNLAFAYNLPYRLAPPGGRVLIVGAGMGNDVAAALRNGAGHVEAVEIDPVILALGRELHPERPYDDLRVAHIVDDARSYFKKSADRYDVIAFGLLDSHTLLSGLSNVRLDSFVYTLESFEQVRGHLAPGGLAVVTFGTHDSAPWIEQRLGRMLGEVFGSGRVYAHVGPGGTTFVAGLVAPERLAELQLTTWQADHSAEDVPLATDDWPYLYLRTRTLPATYWQAILLIGVVCMILIGRSFPSALRPNWHFFLLGGAFLLVEFKSITELALLFGTTWLVNALAISGVLLMVLAANLVVLKRPRLNLTPVYALLFASLALTYVLPLDVFAGFTPVVRAVASMVVLSLPLFFAGLIFGESLRRAGETAGPLASNLSGSVAGGVLEYGSLWWGVKSLYLIAAVVYLGALIASRIQKQ